MMRLTPVSILVFLFVQMIGPLFLTAQSEKQTQADPGFCAHDFVMKQAASQSPGFLQRHQAMEDQLYQYSRKKKKVYRRYPRPSVEKSVFAAPYTLPVVVHIIHNGGVENITDAQVLQGIQDLNDAYANVGYYDPTTGVNTDIQFCLAQRDPGGNATTGINRVQTPLTNMTLETDDITVKDLSRWDPTSYINIWLVKEICSVSYGCGVAGYAYFPSSHGQPEDGIMMEAEYFGSSQGASGVQVHEMGHYLGLYHTFQGGCVNNDCLADGDRVCDTPPDQSTAPVPCGGIANSCSTDTDSGFSTDQDDLFQDYMDYGDFNCWSVFTQGQTDRMHWHIENVRSSLLESQGCMDPCTSALTASFSTSTNTLNVGGTVNFTNTSTNTTSASWEIDGTPFSTSTNASYTFSQVGTFEICLETGNTDPNCSDRFCETITTTCPVQAGFLSNNLYPNPGEAVTYTNSSNTTAVSEWSVNGVVQGNSTHFTFNFPTAGIYTVCLIAGNGLCTAEYCLPVFVSAPPTLPTDCDSTFLKIYGTPQDDEIGHALAKVPDALGGGYLIGGGKADSAMLTLLNPAGDIVWTRAFDATSDAADFIWDISFDSDNNVIGSGNTRDEPFDNIECFAFKYNMVTNTMLWVNELDINDPAQEVYYSIFEKTPGSNYVIAGYTDQLGFSTTGSNAFLIELNRNTGANVWQRNLNLGDEDNYHRAIPSAGAIFATGAFDADNTPSKIRPGISKFDLGGNLQWSRRFLRPVGAGDNARMYGKDIIEDNGLVVFGQGDKTGTSLTNVSLFLMKTDYNGNLVWARDLDITGGSGEQATRLVNLPDGYLCLGYFTQGDQDVFIFKTDKMGNLVWSKSYGSNGTEDGFDMLWDNGLIYFTGMSDGIGTSGSEDLFLATLTPNGEPTAQDNCDLFSDLPMTNVPFATPFEGPVTLANLSQNWNQFLQSAILGETSVQATVACGGPCAEVCDNGYDDDGDGYVDCYDTDCPCSSDDCVANPADLEQNFATKLAWQSTINEVSVDGTPMVANLNPQIDSIPEIIVIESKASITSQLSTNLLIFKGDGSNAANPKKLPITNGYDGYSAVNPAVGDIDGNGIPEVVMVSSDRRIRVYSYYNETANPPMQQIIVSTDLADHQNRKPYLADFDGDGMAEVYVGDDIFRFDAGFTTLTKVLNGGSSAGLQYYNDYQEPNCSPIAVDILQPIHCNGDPDCDGLELVAGNVIYSVDLSTTDGDGVQIKIQRNLNTMQSQFDYKDGYTSVADVDLDGILDVVVSSGRNDNEGVYVWNRNGLIEWFQHPPAMNAKRSGGLPCIANVYDDTQSGAAIDFPEIIVCSEFHLNCYNVNAAQLGQPGDAWWNLSTTDGSGLTGATVFDFNGDGIEEIIYRDENNMRIMYGGAAPFPAGVDTERNWETFTAGSGTFDEHPVVADVDNDGQANIILTSYTFSGTNNPPADYRGRLRIFESDLTAGDPWLSARPIWNQFNYFVVNVNDNLSIPAQQQLHHLEFPAVGSQHRPFNKYIAQTSLLNDDFLPYLPVPDATVSVDVVSCGPDSVSLLLNICNEGDALLPDGTPIAFYIGDPTATAATLHFVALLNVNVLEGDCFTQTVNIPAVNGVDVYVVVNDNGSVPAPYNLSNDFPVTNIFECNYLNNPAAVFINFNSPTLDLGPDTTLCQFGVVVLDAGPGFAEYQWSDGTSEQTTTIWNPGTYWVTAIDSCGGVQSDTIKILVDSTAVVNLGPDVEVCEGGSHTFNVGGFVSYEWSPADYLDCTDCPNPTTTPQSDITYTLVATNAEGCVGVDSVAVTLLPGFAVTDSVAICQGETITVFGNPVNTAGVFSQTFTSSGGCDSTQTIVVTLLPTFDLTDSIAICQGETVTVFGTTVDTAGVFTQTFTAASGCDSIQTIIVTLLPVVESIEDAYICEGDTLLVFGIPVFETGQYSQVFTSQNGCDSTHTISVGVLENVFTEETIAVCFGETADIFGTPTGTAGTYEMTFTSAVGCDSTHTITLEVNDEIFIIFEKADATCNGGSDGSATTSSSGGSGNFTYLWEGGETTAELTGLAAGTYAVTVTDDNGCTASASVTVSEPAQLELEVSVVNVTCDELGSATATATGGTPPISFLWSTGDTTATITDLIAITYVVIATDANGCFTGNAADINGGLGPEVEIVIDAYPTATDPNGGALTAVVRGGTGQLIVWSTGEFGASITGLSSGEYDVLVVDDNGCTATDTVQLYIPACTGGKIWEDVDRDGCQDGGEFGIAGVNMSLFGVDIWGNDIIDSTLTAINGEYIFENLPPGEYIVFMDIPSGYTVTEPGLCNDDFNDSDFDESGVVDYLVTLVEGHCCLIVDGGLYESCLNVTHPGVICCDQVLCGPGNDPAPLTATTPATGAANIEYMWIFAHEPVPPSLGNGYWQPVMDAFGNPVMTAGYDPGPLSQTTWFARCVRAAGCENWLETNAVKITVDDVAVAAINDPGAICVGDAVTFTAAPNGPGATYSWNFGPGATPSVSSQQTVTVTYNQPGYINVTLTVVKNGCTSTDAELVAVSDNPVYCGWAIIAPGNGPGTSTVSGEKRFEVFPNPVGDRLAIQWNDEVKSAVQLEILGVEGRVLLTGLAGEGDMQYSADVSALMPGMYLLRLRFGEGEQAVFRVVKQ